MAKAKKLSLPPGWDVDSLKEAAVLCRRIIETYEDDPLRVRRFSRYTFAQEVFDDEKVPSNLEIIQDVDPVNYPLIRKQVKGVQRLVTSAFNGADPYYIFSGGNSDAPSELREARESDTQLALEEDKYTRKTRESARMAAIKARGVFRLNWEERKRGDGWMDAANVNDGDMEYVGPSRESIDPEDFGIYPLSCFHIPQARAVWHRFDDPMYVIWEKQARGEYFSEDLVGKAVANHEQDNAVDLEEDWAPNLYSGIFKLPEGMDRSKPLKAYRLTLYKTTDQILYMEPYTLPRPDYFAPGFEYDPMMFWPTHSIASSAMEMQTALNDVQFARLMAAIASIKRTVLGSGGGGDSTTQPLGLGDLIMYRQKIDFTVVPTGDSSNSDLGNLSEDAKRYAEGVTGFSDVAAGQLPESSQTATATGGALQGTADEGEEKRQNFIEEEIEAVQFIQILIRRNFKSFKKFHKDRLKTTKATDWEPRFTIGANGQGPNNNPSATMEKLKLLQDAFQSLQIPWLEDVESGKAENIGVALSRVELAKAIEQNLDLSMNTEKIIVDTSQIVAPPQTVPDIQGPLGAIGGAEQVPGLGGQPVPPELLAILAGGGQMPLPPPMAPIPQGPMLGGVPTDIGPAPFGLDGLPIA